LNSLPTALFRWQWYLTISLDGSGALEGERHVVVVVVHLVHLTHTSRPLSDPLKHRVHDMMGYIGSEHVKDEAVRAGQLEVLQAPCLHSSNQDRSG